MKSLTGSLSFSSQKYQFTPDGGKGAPVPRRLTDRCEEQFLELKRGARPVRVSVTYDVNGTVATIERAEPRAVVDGFVNAYGFVPFAERPKPGKPLGDAAPLGHDRWHEGRWTGWLDVSISTVSPLLVTNHVPDVTVGGEQHATRDTVTDHSGAVSLSGASVKGMLRGVYEQVTASRLGVFDGHEERLTLRRTAEAAQDLLPAVVEAVDGETRYLRVVERLLPVPRTGTDPSPHVSVPAYGGRHRAVQWSGGQTLVDGAEVDAVIRLTTPFAWVASAVGPTNANGLAGAIGQARAGHQPWALVRGRLHVTEKTFPRKHTERPRKYAERLVVTEVLKGRAEADFSSVTVQADAVARWKAVIRSYAAAAELSTGTRAAYEQHADEWERLAVGRTCFVDKSRGHQPLPAMVGRDSYDVSPAELLRGVKGGLEPADDLARLSPADRVFGWVAPGGDEARSAPAHRGQLRVGAVDGTRVHPVLAPGGKHLLPPLATPKPQNARMYARDEHGNPLDGEEKSATLGFRSGQQLAGAKVYVTHRRPPDGAGPLPSALEGVAEKLTTAVLSYVPVGAVFQVRLWVDDLSAMELGALVWVLSLPDGHHLKLGMGRPLGLGAVHVKVEATSLRRCAAAGHEPPAGSQQAVYWSLTPADDGSDAIEPAVEEVRKQFDTWLDATMPEVCSSVLAAAQGFDLPTHYPRVHAGMRRAGDPVPDRAESYEWYVQNERLKSERRALPLLTTEPPVMRYLPKPARQG